MTIKRLEVLRRCFKTFTIKRKKHLTKNRSFPLKISSVNVVTFTEGILMENFIFCAVKEITFHEPSYLQNLLRSLKFR